MSSPIAIHLLQHASTLGDLSTDVLVEDGLDKNKNSAVLALDTQLLSLDVDVDGINLVNGALLLGLHQNPVTKIIVNGVATFLLVIISNIELLLELARKLGLTGLDSFLADIDSPVIVPDLSYDIDLGSFGLHLLELIVTAGVGIFIVAVGTILGRFLAAAAAAIFLAGSAILLGLFGSPALGLVFLATLLGLVLENEAAQLKAEVNVSALTTGLAVKNDVTILDVDVGLGVLALLAENKLVDEAIEVVLELGRIVSAVDDPAVVLGIHVGLGTQFEAKVLDDVGSRAGEGLSDAGQVDNDGLDTVSFAFNLGLETLHLVAIKGVADIAADVDERHVGGIAGGLGKTLSGRS